MAGRLRPCSFENIIELLLEGSWLGERPVRIFLMTKYNIFEDSLGYPEQMRNLGVHLGTFRRDYPSLGTVNKEHKTIKRPQTFPPLSAFPSANANILSRVFIVKPAVFFTVTDKLRTVSMRV